MTFKFIVKPQSVAIEFEAGSVAEGAAILDEESNAIGALFKACPWLTNDEPAAQVNAAAVAPASTEPTRRGRGKNKNQPDPSTAQAPPPVPTGPPPMPPGNVPPTAPQPPGDLGIPQFLQHTPAPPAPPVPAAPAPQNRLGPLVKAELDKRATDDATKSAYADWLVKSGVALSGSTYAEAMAVVGIAKDEELKTVADQLGIK